MVSVKALNRLSPPKRDSFNVAIRKPEYGYVRLTGVLIIPFTSAVVFQSVGVLFLQDIIAPFVLLLLLAQPGAVRQLSPLKICFALLCLWFFGLAISDWYNGSAVVDFARGWSRLILLGVNIAMIWLLCRGSAKLISYYTICSGLASVLGALTSSDPYTMGDPWKFGAGAGLITVAAGLTGIPYFRDGVRKYLPEIFVLVLSVVSLLLNSRTMFAIGALSAGYSLLARWILRHRRSISKLGFAGIFLSGVIFAQVIVSAYEYSASEGILGDTARQKYLMQTNNDAGLLLSGRSESLVSLEAIGDSPILGHGSWAKDPYYTIVYYVKQRQLGLDVPANWKDVGFETDYFIQSHSHLLGSWVEAGILSVPFWGWTLILAFSSLYGVVARRDQPNVMIITMALILIWDVLFSPFSAQARITKALQIVVLVLSQQMVRARTLERTAKLSHQLVRLRARR
ncbi:hypothetical protein C8J42_10953 [Sphingomonas sp. PP-CE-1A-559]|uniref:hypothetical protein n=1 Tax=Sphingomonas sp. PP-CE-1A-559 TaxID=2135657 RepID=UPI0010CFBFB1|nr:hypothetical protein [Sphingomonas sp. PP-CE-1A-559]TCP87592.1 hypothetical protein C8J42_10953 [Sphingomonas sp. PP-CE-1A-559]